jgi:hypothetical protein
MLGDALVGFRRDMTILLLSGSRLLQHNFTKVFGMPDARMSSCLFFAAFHWSPHLDKLASGIPNAIASHF